MHGPRCFLCLFRNLELKLMVGIVLKVILQVSHCSLHLAEDALVPSMGLEQHPRNISTHSNDYSCQKDNTCRAGYSVQAEVQGRGKTCQADKLRRIGHVS